MQFVAAMQPGWGLGNSLDAIPDETSWGNPPVTKALLDTVRAQGFHSVRIPVTWSGHEGPAPAYTIDPAFMSRVKQVVDWALADGLYVVLNVHHDSWQWISSMPTDPQRRARALQRHLGPDRRRVQERVRQAGPGERQRDRSSPTPAPPRRPSCSTS